MLPDILAPHLKVVFCGTAVGTRSAEQGHYYSHPANKFWKVLAETGFTPRQLSPDEDATLPQYGIGLTDLVKKRAGGDSSLRVSDFEIAPFRAKIVRYAPIFVCFVGKEAAKVYFDYRHVDYGLQQEQIGRSRVFIAPSTSGAASRYWDIEHWHDLRRLVTDSSPHRTDVVA